MRVKAIYGGYYLISDLGIIIRNSPEPKGYFGKEIKWGLSVKGYARVTLQIDGKKFNKFVHSLVAEAFIGPCPAGKEVNHKDTDKWNNSYTNLEYTSHRKNIKHAASFGLMRGCPGEKCQNSKLTDRKVLQIRKLAGTVSRKDLAKRFKVLPDTITSVVKRRTWRHL